MTDDDTNTDDNTVRIRVGSDNEGHIGVVVDTDPDPNSDSDTKFGTAQVDRREYDAVSIDVVAKKCAMAERYPGEVIAVNESKGYFVLEMDSAIRSIPVAHEHGYYVRAINGAQENTRIQFNRGEEDD